MSAALGPRGTYHRLYYRTRLASVPMQPTESLYVPRCNGRLPQISREHYWAVKAWKRQPRESRPKLAELACRWGYDPGYLALVSKRRIDRYEREEWEAVIAILCEAVDEARAQP